MSRVANPDAPTGDAFMALTEQIARESGLAVGSYKRGCLARRIAARMRARGAADHESYARLLRDDPTEYRELIDALTINVTRLFRDPDVWDAVATRVLPRLWDAGHDRLRTWVAGCASGEEAYTVAALWRQLAEERGEVARLWRVAITATDLDPDAVATASRGCYPADAFRDAPPAVRARYFSAAEPYAAAPALRELLAFERRDLLSCGAPGGTFSLITCRNVLIYFDRPSQDAVLRRFHEALAPGGYLVVGKSEAILGHARDLFEVVDHRVRLFRRAG